MFIRFMHSAVSRLLRACIGWALVVGAVYQPMGIAIVMMVAGTIIAVLAIADVCVTEQVIDGVRRHGLAAAEPDGHGLATVEAESQRV